MRHLALTDDSVIIRRKPGGIPGACLLAGLAELIGHKLRPIDEGSGQIGGDVGPCEQEASRRVEAEHRLKMPCKLGMPMQTHRPDQPSRKDVVRPEPPQRLDPLVTLG
jgi:hypothetical protein